MRTRLLRAVFVAVMAAASCTAGAGSAGTSGSSAASSGSIAPSATPISTAPAGVAAQLEAVTTRLDGEIDAWRATGGTSSWPPPTSLAVDAVTEQRIFGTLALHPALLHATLPRLPDDLRAATLANAAAAARLLSLVQPSGHTPTIRARAPLPAARLLGYYRAAQRRFGVPWQMLAAVNMIESRFGRVISNSSAGAQGPMQFIPSTWAAYGLGGDIHDPHDAVMGAANYLHASGAPAHPAAALYRYNPAHAYVAAVLLYARQMMRDPRAFYAYYNWQVFALTPEGLQQLTGPGS